MNHGKKEETKKDLIRFSKAKDYYKRVGKPWKRGYLLLGPPGTRKSKMVSAIANFLENHVYDLELTTVKDNSDLKRLLLDTTGKCIIVIEDIDCSLAFTGQKREKQGDKEVEKKKEAKKEKKEDVQQNKLTLSV